MSSKVLKKQLAHLGGATDAKTNKLDATSSTVNNAGTKKAKAHRNYIRTQAKRQKALDKKAAAKNRTTDIYARNLGYFIATSKATGVAESMRLALEVAACMQFTSVHIHAMYMPSVHIHAIHTSLCVATEVA